MSSAGDGLWSGVWKRANESPYTESASTPTSVHALPSMLDCRIPLITASTGYEPLTQSERTASFCSSRGFFT